MMFLGRLRCERSKLAIGKPQTGSTWCGRAPRCLRSCQKSGFTHKTCPKMVIISGHILCVNPRFGSIPVIEAHALPRRGPSGPSRWSILIAHITIYQKNISLEIIGLTEWTLYKYAPTRGSTCSLCVEWGLRENRV